MARLHLDENVSTLLRRALSDLDHDTTRTDDPYRAGTPAKGTPDHRQLWYAATVGAVLVTLDAWDFALLDDAWRLWGVPRSHPGIIGLAAFGPTAVLTVAEAVDAFVRHPEETLALQGDAGEAVPLTNGDGTLTNQFYYRWLDGRWTTVPPKPRR